MKVRDFMTGDIYIRKQQQILLDEKLMKAARNHVKQEIQRLKSLRYRHVIQFIKSYERGGVYGLVVKPAAECNLRELLNKFDKDEKKYSQGSFYKFRNLLPPVSNIGFGCLAQGLANVVCFTIACIAVALRFLARRMARIRYEIDDWLILVALVRERPSYI